MMETELKMMDALMLARLMKEETDVSQLRQSRLIRRFHRKLKQSLAGQIVCLFMLPTTHGKTISR
jgi:hypothetical protein